VAFKREDGCGVLRFDVAFARLGDAGHGHGTRVIRDRMANRPAFQVRSRRPRTGASFPFRRRPDPGCRRAGDSAVGISGDASDKDEYCAIGAVKAAACGQTGGTQSEWRNAGL